MRPRMIVVAGPPGSGKSSVLPGSAGGTPFFNADDRAAALNAGCYHAIPQSIRDRVNREFEAFVSGHIASRTSFALETTLRSDITFRQARQAKAAGFDTVMFYVAVENIEMNMDRVRARADAGGHSASETRLRAIHAASMKNLPVALREIEHVAIFDNSRFAGPTELLMTTHDGVVTFRRDPLPAWLADALAGTEFLP